MQLQPEGVYGSQLKVSLYMDCDRLEVRQVLMEQSSFTGKAENTARHDRPRCYELLLTTRCL